MRKRSLIKYLIIISIIIVGIYFIKSYFEEEKKKDFTIGTNYWIGHEPFYFAKSQNMFKTNLDLKTYDSSTIVLNKFRLGEIQAAALTLDEVILLKTQGYSPVIVAVLNISLGADVILGNKHVKSLSQLKGKAVGVEYSALGGYILMRALTGANLTTKDVDILPIDINHHQEAFELGIVDAVVTSDPVRKNLIKLGANELFSSKNIPYEIVNVLAVDKKHFKRLEVEDTLTGLYSALQNIKRRDKRAIKLITDKRKIPLDDFESSVMGIKFSTRKESNQLLSDGTILETVDRIQKIMFQEKFIGNTFNSKDVFP